MLEPLVIERKQLDTLLGTLSTLGFQAIGPVLEQGTITYAPLQSASDLPAGLVDEQLGGHYRLHAAAPGGGDERALFRYTLGPHSWKRFLFPPRQRLWRAGRKGDGFNIEPGPDPQPRYALFGVRPCELAAMAIQDRVFDNGDFVDSGYRARRDASFVVAVDCTRAGGTCFCTSMHTGPEALDGFDLCLTELATETSHRFLVRVGSERGAQVMAEVLHRPAEHGEIEAARQLTEAAAAAMGRHMHSDAAEVLKRNPEHPRWQEVAHRCLSCANCTLVCPTCFCSTLEDTTSLDGTRAERWRVWDSCFTVDFSYIHGGSVRQEGAARYRQWITHKLAHWHGQFGTSGCTGCGRCITWCPVGIDITEEVAAIHASEGK